jgi:hypothetical protein
VILEVNSIGETWFWKFMAFWKFIALEKRDFGSLYNIRETWFWKSMAFWKFIALEKGDFGSLEGSKAVTVYMTSNIKPCVTSWLILKMTVVHYSRTLSELSSVLFQLTSALVLTALITSNLLRRARTVPQSSGSALCSCRRIWTRVLRCGVPCVIWYANAGLITGQGHIPAEWENLRDVTV